MVTVGGRYISVSLKPQTSPDYISQTPVKKKEKLQAAI